jgi:hypothetical protein
VLAATRYGILMLRFAEPFESNPEPYGLGQVLDEA